MPERPADTVLLRAVELLMGQFSEQILTLLESHARGDLAPEEFEARIRELVGTVSPEALARHPGRLSLVRPAPAAPPSPAVEPPVSPEPIAPDVAAPAAGEESGFPGRMDAGFQVDFEPGAGGPLPELPDSLGPDLPALEFVESPGTGAGDGETFPSLVPAGDEALAETALAAEPPAQGPVAAGVDRLPGEAPGTGAVVEPPLTPAAAGPSLILDGVSGFEPLPEFDAELPREPAAQPALAQESLPFPTAEPSIGLAEPALGQPPTSPEVPASGPAPSLILDGVSGFEPLPELELGDVAEPSATPVPGPEAPAGPKDVSGLEPPVQLLETSLAEPPESEPAQPAIQDGASGFEPLPEITIEPFVEAAPGLGREPEAPAEPVAPAPPLPAPSELTASETAIPADSPQVAEPAPEAPAAEPGSLLLDGVSGYEHLLEPELPEPEPSPVPRAARPAAKPAAPPKAAPQSPRSAPGSTAKPPVAGKSGAPAPPVAPPRPGKGVPVTPAPPSPTSGGKPTPAQVAPAGGAPQPAKSPTAPASPGKTPPQAAPGKAPAPPPRRPVSGGSGNVVVSGRMAGDTFKSPDRPTLGFGEQMFGNGGNGEAELSHETSFVSRQVRRDLEDKSTYRSPGKAALLSVLLPGVGDFYLGKVANGLVFYLVFYVLLMLLILRGDLILVPVLLVLALTSAGFSWLAAHKHNDAIHRLQDAPSLRQKTRETTFTLGNTRRRR